MSSRGGWKAAARQVPCQGGRDPVELVLRPLPSSPSNKVTLPGARELVRPAPCAQQEGGTRASPDAEPLPPPGDAETD